MLLDVRNFRISFGGREIVTVEHLSLEKGVRLGLVGESGSGKTLMAMSLAGLQPPSAVVTGQVLLDGTDFATLDDVAQARTRGRSIGVVFQDPLRSLNPLSRVGTQIAETLRINTALSRSQIEDRVAQLAEQVRLPASSEFLRRYPHQLSGGQRQRVLIAMAIAHSPKLILADEPTTALDVTVQREILELLLSLCKAQDIALIFVSHNLGVVRAVSENVAVLYGGQIVEIGSVDSVLGRPAHRYTEALIGANPGRRRVSELPMLQGQNLNTIEGSVATAGRYPRGCRFRPRCNFALAACELPIAEAHRGADHSFLCINPSEHARGV